MSNRDFEKAWLAKFSRCLQEIGGEEIRKEIMKGSDEIIDGGRGKVLIWSKKAMEIMDSLLDEKKRVDIMTGCGCQYPQSDLYKIRRVYQETNDIQEAHSMLQAQFESFLKNTLRLSDEIIEDLVQKGMGSAGVIKEDTIIATKIPKSSHLREYLNEPDPERKRALYCHCPRIRDALTSGTQISGTYCYCGAGFYKKIWEYILKKPVHVEVRESVLQGDDVCRIVIYLPKK